MNLWRVETTQESQPKAGEVGAQTHEHSSTPRSNDWIGATASGFAALICFNVPAEPVTHYGSLVLGAVAVGYTVSWSRTWSRSWRFVACAVVLGLASLFIIQLIAFSLARAR